MEGKIKEVFSYFFKLGFIAFGGPAAHIAMMEEDLVKEKKWMEEEEFLDYMGATNLIPGPNSTEMTMHCGYHKAGIAGLFVAGISFILPAVTITVLIAMLFEEYGQLDHFVPIVAGIKAGVLSFIIGAIYRLGKKAVKTYILFGLGALVIAASFLGLNEILCILLAGIIYAIFRFGLLRNKAFSLSAIPLFMLLNVQLSNLKLFFIFLKIGAVLFGSGYVLFAYLDGELIDQMGWLTHSDLVEAIAVGQLTPGPVLSTASFIGYKLAGIQGAILATLGIFLPSFFYVWVLNPLIPKMRSNKFLSFFLEGVNVAAVAVMLVVSIKMFESIVIDWKTGLICAISFAAYFGLKKINPMWIILSSALLAFLLQLV